MSPLPHMMKAPTKITICLRTFFWGFFFQLNIYEHLYLLSSCILYTHFKKSLIHTFIFSQRLIRIYIHIHSCPKHHSSNLFYKWNTASIRNTLACDQNTCPNRYCICRSVAMLSSRCLLMRERIFEDHTFPCRCRRYLFRSRLRSDTALFIRVPLLSFRRTGCYNLIDEFLVLG